MRPSRLRSAPSGSSRTRGSTTRSGSTCETRCPLRGVQARTGSEVRIEVDFGLRAPRGLPEHVAEHEKHGQEEGKASGGPGGYKAVLVQNPMAYVHAQVRVGGPVVQVLVGLVVGVGGIEVRQSCELFPPSRRMGQSPGNPIFPGPRVS